MASTSTEIYQAFMIGYVRRINEATLNVTIGGVRIGHAKYSRLAQINLRTRIITFSRYAIEQVPEHCRRYLVIHELSHVKEARHNKRFWNIVGKYVPDCRKVEMELQEIFQKNIRDQYLAEMAVANDVLKRLENNNRFNGDKDIQDRIKNGEEAAQYFEDEMDDNCFGCLEDEFGAWTSSESGIVSGGSDSDIDTGPANVLITYE